MAKWSDVSWKRVGKVLLVIFLTPTLLLGVKALVDRHLEPFRTARYLAANNPDLDRVPVPLPEAIPATLSGARISHFGFSVQLPWRESYRDQESHNVALISVPHGGLLTIQDPSSSYFPVGTIRMLANLLPALRGQSNYALTTAVMNVTSEKVKWWKTPGQNAKDSELLLMKDTLETKCHGSIYVIQFGGMRGFQQGNPSAVPYCVTLVLFDSADRPYEFDFGKYPEDAPFVTQAEINAMVASLKPISEQ